MRARTLGLVVGVVVAVVGAEAAADDCLVVRELGGEVLIQEGAPTCTAEPLGPCSTYKIPHAILGLDAGVLSGPEATYAWDGSDQYFDAWERDHDLGSALKHSVVWYFQRLATDLGEERTQAFLDRIDYGNRDLSAGLTTYWLGTSLTVTVDQQLSFLDRLYRDQLPVDPQAMATVRELIVYEEGPGWAVSGKTGTCRPEGAPGHGWYVGHLKTEQRELVFASWQRNDGNPWGRDVRDDVLARLRQEGWLPQVEVPDERLEESPADGGAAAEVSEVIRRHQPQLRQCYELALKEDPAMHAACALSFVIGPEGTVTSLDLAQCEVPPLLEGCLRMEFERMRFPRPVGGGETKVTYPLNVDWAR